jgi:hypothetical protein
VRFQHFGDKPFVFMILKAKTLDLTILSRSIVESQNPLNKGLSFQNPDNKGLTGKIL